MSPQTAGKRLIVVSNRLPFVLSKEDGGKWRAAPGSGGLVSALVPLLRNRGGTWVGWPGTVDMDASELTPIVSRLNRDSGYTLRPVMLTAGEKQDFYHGFSNEIVWPLFHDLLTNCNFDPGFWRSYQQVNRKFAHIIADNSRADDFIWVNDYHLMGVARELRGLGHKARTGFFLHIPFPSLDIFLKLPWRFDILCGLLQFDLLGFQTLRDRRNFVQCVRTLLNDVTTKGKGQVLSLLARGKEVCPNTGERNLRIGTFPISVDFKAHAARAEDKEVVTLAEYFHYNLRDRQMILGVDRLDYTKGIPNKLAAFRNALRRYPDLMQQVTLIQHVIPSREDITEYNDLKLDIERLVSEINGEYTRSGWVPIHYIYGTLTPTELAAYYRAADIALVTPLKDGMNLVAKEYCAANTNENGILILSEFAGAAAQLQKGALMVNPHDVNGVADRIYDAFTMSWEERSMRMRRLRRNIRENDIFRWVDSFLGAAIEKDLGHFPVIEDYVPHVRLA